MKDLQALKAALYFSEDIIGAASCGILAYQGTGRCVLANPAAAEISGGTVEQLLRQNFRQLESWRTSGMLALAETVLATGQKQREEYHSVSTFGRELWIICQFSVFVCEGEQYLVLVTEDNTRHREMERDMAGSQDFLAKIINSVATPVFVLDRQHRNLLVNDACCQITQCGREELVGKTVRDFFPAGEAEDKMADEEKVFLTGQESVNEEKLTDARGMVHTVITKKTLYRDKHGQEFLVGVVQDITERKQAEVRLAEAVQYNRTLFESAPVGIISCKATGEVVSANAAAAEIVGGSLEHILRQNFRRLESWKPSGMLAAAEEALATGREVRREVHLTSSFGKASWLNARFTVFSHEGEVYLLVMMSNITEQKQAEAALRESEHRYRSLFTNMVEGLAHCRVLFADGKPHDLVYLGVNDAFQTLTGLKDVVGRKISEVIPGIRESDPELLERYGRVALTGRPERFEIHVAALKMWFSISVYSPQKEHIVAVFDMITERKQQEEQLRKLSRAVEQSPVSIIITDTTGSIEYVNPKFVQVTGYAPAEVMGKNPRLLKSGDLMVNQEKHYKKLWSTILSGREWHGEFHNRKKNGELFWEAASISPITDAGGSITHFLAVKEDITAHKLLEDEFRQAQKMDAFGKLAAGVAHDFNNIITAILGYAELVKISLPPNGNQREGLTEIIRMAERAANLTRQLLLFSRRQAMQVKELELNEVVETISKMLRRLIGEHITLNTSYSAGHTRVTADPGMLEQVLMNLAVNSRDAMPKGGELTIQTAPVEFKEATARRRPGRFIRLTVTDTGCGIPPENLEHIFEPFFTTKEVGKGTGLGLATVFGIVEQHKGWIEVETKIESGTTFHIYLPCHEAAGETDFIHQPKIRERGGTETILLVEDEPSVRELTRTILEQHGYTVLEAGSGVAALAVWKEHQADIALLLTDMVMPGNLNGLELSRQLLPAKPGLKVLYTSGYTDEMLDEGSALRHTPNFLEKPFAPDMLLRKVRAVLD